MEQEHQTEYLLRTVASELRDVTRLFALPAELWEEEHQPHFHWRAWEADSAYHCDFALGERQRHRDVPVPVAADERTTLLEEKRVLKRLCKQTLYDLCKDVTGITPPWGSLTGIRPTRLVYEAMEHGRTLDEACAQVGQEFDVSEEKLRLLHDTVAVQSTLPAPDDGAVDVYIGIPFCTTRCAYCTFLSGELGKGKLVEPYLAALFREMAAGAELLSTSGKKLRALYVGGGTPTALNPDQLRRMVHMALKLFPGAMEYTVEAGRPDTLTLEKLEILRDAGIRRISINPQTMNDKTLEVIGRRHTVRQVYDAYAMARQVGFHHVNMDVIAGLPGEDLDDFARTMAALVFRSPTCTPIDVNAANRLAKIAGVDINEFANEMFEAGEKLDGKTAEEVFLQDFKVFMCGDIRFGVAQGSYMTRKNLTAAEALLKPYLEEARNKQNVEDIYMLLTDVPKEESVVICDGRYAAGVLTDGFEIQPGADGSWTLPGVVSRKKQFIPALMTAYQEL